MVVHPEFPRCEERYRQSPRPKILTILREKKMITFEEVVGHMVHDS